ncbi:MAG: hypothetical protein ABEI96_06900 [Haloarculaceae archaeon]
MRVVLDGRVVEGHAIDLPSGLETDAVVAAIRETHDRLTVSCPPAGRIHRFVGVIDGSGVDDERRALAAVARSRGAAVSEDRLRAETRRQIAALEIPDASPETARRRVANAAADERRLRERVAELRGRRRERERHGGDVESVQSKLADAIGELSEVETERVAAEQALSAATERARKARAARERRFELEDEAANLGRRARVRLAEAIAEPFADAVAAVPGTSAVDPAEADDTTVALALARLASLRAPVVLDCDRFPDADAAAAWLDAPVVRL